MHDLTEIRFYPPGLHRGGGTFDESQFSGLKAGRIPVVPEGRLLLGGVIPVPAARPRRITRFTVMATLQAARARRLGLSEASSYSWGLNRAIFYAAAKRGFRAPPVSGPAGESGGGPSGEVYSLGDDYAYRDPAASELLFTIGGETQTEEGFRKQVAARFGGEREFRRAWDEAMELVGEFDEDVLRSGRQFYSAVYKPRRDALVAKWTDLFVKADSK